MCTPQKAQYVQAESEVRGSLDVLKVIFMDHTFQPRAAETLGNLRCLLGGFDKDLCAKMTRSAQVKGHVHRALKNNASLNIEYT